MMDTLTIVGLGVTILVAAIGATWALRSKLSALETSFSRALSEHVLDDLKKHDEIVTRVFNLEKARIRRAGKKS